MNSPFHVTVARRNGDYISVCQLVSAGEEDRHGENAVSQGKARAGRRRGGAAVAISLAAGLALVACSSGGNNSSSGASSTSARAKTAACPSGATTDPAGTPT